MTIIGVAKDAGHGFVRIRDYIVPFLSQLEINRDKKLCESTFFIKYFSHDQLIYCDYLLLIVTIKLFIMIKYLVIVTI